MASKTKQLRKQRQAEQATRKSKFQADLAPAEDRIASDAGSIRPEPSAAKESDSSRSRFSSPLSRPLAPSAFVPD